MSILTGEDSIVRKVGIMGSDFRGQRRRGQEALEGREEGKEETYKTLRERKSRWL